MSNNPHKQFLLELADLMDKYDARFEIDSYQGGAYFELVIECDDGFSDLSIVDGTYDLETLKAKHIRKTANEL